VKPQPTEDIGGGMNLGWISDRSWMVYNVNLSVGRYRVEFRVSSLNGGGSLRMDTDKGKTVFARIEVPKTDGWQKWVTISQDIHVRRATPGFGIFAIKGGWNINWIRITQLGS
jgi:hypothetical protein